jgi:radical SAM superfamily enzyme YgiQ (UPF0313 family)
LFKNYGIFRMGFLMLGGPGETKESVRASLAFVDTLEPDSVHLTIGVRIYPYTSLAETARREGMITREDDLLFPKFYMTPGLKDWLYEEVGRWASTRPSWVV